MRETSELYKRLLDNDAHVKESRLTIGGTVYEQLQIVSLSTSEPLFAEDTMSIGGAVAREIDFAAFLDDSVPKRAQIIHEVRLVLGDKVSEWLQKGVYYIDTRSRDPLTGVTTVHGFDAMLMAEQEWIPPAKDEFPMPMKEAVELTAAALGLEIDSRTTFKMGDAYKVDYPVADADESEEQQAKGLSIRQMWRWVAAAHGGNFIINDLGQLRLVPLNALPGNTGYLVTESGRPISFGGVRILIGQSDSGSSVVSNDKVYVGNRTAEVASMPALEPISKIILKVDDNNAYVSKSDTEGLTLEVDCAYGSKQMADDLLTQLQGYVYRPVQAEDALIDPAAELGDGVTIYGVYTILAQKDTLWDLLSAADIGAPGKAELESEFRFTSSTAETFQYQLAATRSLIAKNSESVQILVERTDGLGQQYAALDVALDEITLTVSGINRDVAALELRADGIEASVSSVKTGLSQTVRIAADGVTITNAAGSKLTIDGGQIDAENLNLTGRIAFRDLASAVQNDIDEAWEMAYDAKDAAYDAADTVDAWRYDGGTYIDSSKIMVTTLMATELLGGEVALLTSAERQAGGLDITGSSSSTYAIELWSNGALRLVAEDGDLYMEAGGEHLTIGYVRGEGYAISVSNTFMPNSDGNINLGNYAYYWANAYIEQCYGSAEAASTSDRNKKHDISYDLDRYDPFFDGLKPAVFKLDNGTSGRLHPGLIAQDVEEDLAVNNIPTSDFAGFIKMQDSYALRYGEFIALLIWQVQRLKARVTELEVKAT